MTDRGLLLLRLGELTRHVVSLRAEHEDRFHHSFDNLSGFVVEVGGHWFVITAGHVLKRMNKPSGEEACAYPSRLYAKGFGAAPRDHDLLVEPGVAGWAALCEEDDYWIDVAIVPLSPQQRNMLQAQGVEPLTDAAWPTDRHRFHNFFLLGLPASDRVVITRRFHVLQLDPVEEQDAPNCLARAGYPRYCFRIVRGMDEPEAPLGDITGMSGAPVYGVQEVDGQDRYWLLGIQSGWVPDARIVTVMPADATLKRGCEVLAETLPGFSAAQNNPTAPAAPSNPAAR